MARRGPAKIIQVNLRLPDDLRRQLAREAKRARRSFNQELVLRLEQTFQRVAADTLVENARSMLDRVEQVHRDMMEQYRAEQYRESPLTLRVDPVAPANKDSIKDDKK